MLTVVVGENSNLSQRLAARLPDCRLISARTLGSPADVRRAIPRDREYSLVINSFRTAPQLWDVSDPVDYMDLSLGLTARLLEAIVGTPCRKVVYTSSASVYGDDVHCREEGQARAGDLHSALKLANEQLVLRFCGLHRIDATIARLFNMYGGADRFSVVSKIIQAARDGRELAVTNEGRAVRDFVYVDDVVTSYQALLNARSIPVVNVASGAGVSIRTIIDGVRLRGYSLRVVSDERDEISVSTADVSILRAMVDVTAFTQVMDHVVTALDTADRTGG